MEKRITKSPEEIDHLLPESGKVEDFEFGPNHRMLDETLDDYRLRRKVEQKMFAIRQKDGVRVLNNSESQSHNPKRQQKEYLKEQCSTKKEYKRMKKAMGL